jgi:hypothetical protein
MGPDLFDPDRGQVFRTRARKYEWAPDTYVAFLARNSQTELAVSRDGVNWHIFDAEGDSPYLSRETRMSRGWTGEFWMMDGLIRRGDTIWQYANAGGGTRRKTIRLLQRLDGFASLDAGGQTGTIITRPFIFEGDKLTLNVAAKGTVKVAVLNLPGMEISGYNVGLTDAPKRAMRGFGLGDCDPITADSVRHVVTWKGAGRAFAF